MSDDDCEISEFTKNDKWILLMLVESATWCLKWKQILVSNYDFRNNVVQDEVVNIKISIKLTNDD